MPHLAPLNWIMAPLMFWMLSLMMSSMFNYETPTTFPTPPCANMNNTTPVWFW